MAEKRMFSKTILDSDDFLDMPVTAQLLYFHLALRADDEGFINKPKTIMRICSCKDDDIRILIAKQFIIPFDSGVVAIRHWKVHNSIQPSRLKETQHTDEKALLALKENKEYVLKELCVDSLPTNCQQNDAEISIDIDKNSIDIDIDENSIDTSGSSSAEQNSTPARHKYGEYKNVLLSDEEMEILKMEFPYDWSERIERLSTYMESTGKTYKNFLATIKSWAKNDTRFNSPSTTSIKKSPFNNYEDDNSGTEDLAALDDFILDQMLSEEC